MQYKTDNVFESVWLGCALLSYERFMDFQSDKKQIDENSFWFRQAEIQNVAQNICHKTVQSARVGQWVNGDNSDSSYNYLRENGKLRRLTVPGEFQGIKEYPEYLANHKDGSNGYLSFDNDKQVSVDELVKWAMGVYVQIISGEVSHKEIPQLEDNIHPPERIITTTTISRKKPPFDLRVVLDEFMTTLKKGEIEIYNEFSLQLELAIFLRGKLGSHYNVQLERNVSFFGLNKSNFLKKEMDIVIFDQSKKERYCIELKFPVNGQFPEQMFSICKDIKFLEQLINVGFTECYELVVVDSHNFYNDRGGSDIYEMFRKNKVLAGKVVKPTGQMDEEFILDNEYRLEWANIVGNLKGLTIVV